MSALDNARQLWTRARLAAAISDGDPSSADSAADGSLKIDVDRRTIIVGLAADYGNLGDLAITRAQLEFLARRFPGDQVIAIPISSTTSSLRYLASHVGPGDLVTLIGGGNMGDRYSDIQFLREQFMQLMSNVPTISFSQSVDFSRSTFGVFARARARRAVHRHQRLALMARDTTALGRMTRVFPQCYVALTPDVVLTLDATQPAADREGVTLSLREDSEAALNIDQREAIRRFASGLGTVRVRDTHVGDVRVSVVEAELLLEDFWSSLRASSLVVTDRLHGVIFSVITGTPCLAIDNSIGKVGQFCRDWLHDLSSVVLVEDVSDEGLRAAASAVRSGGADEAALKAALADRFGESFEKALTWVTR